MKITLGLAHDAERALIDILDVERQLLVPQIAKYRLAKMQRQLEPHYAKAEMILSGLVQKYGQEEFEDELKTVSKGWRMTPTSPNLAPYVKEWNEARAELVEVPGLAPITVTALGTEVRAGLSAMEFRLLGDLIVDECGGAAAPEFGDVVIETLPASPATEAADCASFTHIVE